MKYLGGVLATIGMGLLVVAAIGHWTSFGEPEEIPPREWEIYDPSLRTLDSPQKLTTVAKKRLSASPTEPEIMNALYQVVAERFTHGEATHGFFSNWALYLLGQIHPVFLHIWNPALMAKRSALLCDQSSYLLLKLALTNGVKARHIGLGGHVVMEGWYDADWHLYDPDLEVVPVDSAGRVLSVEALAQKPELVDKYYGAHGVADMVSSRENNTYMTYPSGARFEWKANLLAHIENVMETLKFLLPVAMIGGGICLVWRGRA